ncbi:helix-turn-helix domain-containing protein [Pelobium sp.]|nr:helix-turn-helix domain-containing protein [Pelobium sp.]MDA9555378.1 helix-turn-helix domain-containing protein [Pelobium sp.]
MKYQTFKPKGLLKDYVKHFWVLEGEAGTDKPYIHHLFADTSPEMIFYFKGVFYEYDDQYQKDVIIKTGITGQSQQHRKLIAKCDFGVFGVYFYPNAMAKLFNIEAHELKNQLLELKELLGKAHDELEEKMILAANNESRLQIISSFLERKIVRQYQSFNPIALSIQQIKNANGLIGIDALAAQLSISTRQFERNFLSYSGLSPKVFTRIIRFQSALKKLNHIDQSLTQVAYEADYYDQAHFIKDFKTFTGLKPKEFLKYHQKNSLWL